MSGPKVTLEQIESKIAAEFYFTAEEGVYGATPPWVIPKLHETLQLITICVLIMHTGFKVLGHSACVSKENFDAEKGKSLARADAVRQLWALEGYLLSESLHNKPGASDGEQA